MLETFAFAASLAECTLETEVSEAYPGLSLPRERTDHAAGRSRPSSAAATSSKLARTGGGADANVFNARGLPCLNLANGMMEIHTAEEHIAADDLERMVDVTLALVEGARDGAQP